MKNICLICGEPLPEGSSNSRRYCPRCATERNRELSRERLRKGKERQLERERDKQEAKDRAYCKQCVYYGSVVYGKNLCDYLLMTGQRRDCHYGVGCDRRVVHELAK